MIESVALYARAGHEETHRAEENVTLWWACGLVASYNDPIADFSFAKAGPSSDLLVALVEDGTIIGSTTVGHDGHRGWLYFVAAAPNARGLGVGWQMVDGAEAWLRQRCVVKVQLLVRKANNKVISFYERLGFEAEPRGTKGKWLSPSA